MANQRPKPGDSGAAQDPRTIWSGGTIGHGAGPAFTFDSANTRQKLPVLIAAPHAGRDYPDSVLSSMRDPEQVKLRLEDRFVDEVAREAARLSRLDLLVANAPRAMLDLNRSREDVDWSMISGSLRRKGGHSLANRRARSGLGLVPRRLPGFGEIWRGPISEDELQRRIEDIHKPYHHAISAALARMRDEWGAALLIDLHSMPPLQARAGEARGAEFVIGDRFGASCDGGLVAKGLSYFSAQERLVTHNRPYSGGYVLDAHGLPRHGIHALQLEVCRSTYLDGALDRPDSKLSSIAQLVAEFALLLSREVIARGSRSGFALAAE